MRIIMAKVMMRRYEAQEASVSVRSVGRAHSSRGHRDTGRPLLLGGDCVYVYCHLPVAVKDPSVTWDVPREPTD
uniref:Uncharacterized protein n=1 Tax=Knipowitschia caucasica TaxID=637954 RepID=A0AAV2L3Q0_KNICA